MRLTPEQIAMIRRIAREQAGDQMDEYVEDPAVLVSALQSGHRFVPTVLDASNRMRTEIDRRGWS